ncbi:MULTISPECIES: DUF1780 domain-containing protein [Thalassospira]|uniref:DUF1780 domain-containing protein n=1 Tax=Thalassospira TaxID=168934 RepID=UPI0003B5EF5F|nr:MULTISPECIES: DUF1780 domain-containing protein [Thalassospira]RCK18900.1 hypothetical protein TH1_22040 [Thalassospira lucentensis MCCC 1A00383 = DSM 14000]
MNNHTKLKNYWIETLTEWRHYFSNRGKPEREKYCVDRFLEIFDIPHDCKDFIAPEQGSVIDVQWNDLRFQVKEITDLSVNRGEFKEILRKVKKSEDIEDLGRFLVGQSRDVPSVASMYDLVSKESAILSKEKRYVSTKSELDLLFYVTRSHCSLLQPDEAQRNVLDSLGWRSISVVNEKQAVVLSALDNAPDLIRKRKGQIYAA